MADVTAKTIEEIPFYEGPGAIAGIRFRTAARALGVTAWGMNVLELEAGCTGYPEHDHTKDGQEEVYVVLRGGGVLEHGGERVELREGTLVRVGPAIRRKLQPGPQGMTVLALGGTPGQAYPSK